MGWCEQVKVLTDIRVGVVPRTTSVLERTSGGSCVCRVVGERGGGVNERVYLPPIYLTCTRASAQVQKGCIELKTGCSFFYLKGNKMASKWS